MLCSEKFLEPTRTAGLPVPGPLLTTRVVVLAVTAGVLAVVPVVVVDDDLLLPHAASKTASANSASTPAPPFRNALDLVQLMSVIRRLLVVCVARPSGRQRPYMRTPSLRRRTHDLGAGREPGALEPHASRCEQPLDEQ